MFEDNFINISYMFKAEKRLNDEQKFLYKFRRQGQAEAKVLSEEEIRRRRKEKRVNSWHDKKKICLNL
jgi:hypothetical protein